MALCYKAKLPFAFRERDVKAFFTATGALQQELQRKRRLSGARLALDQVQPFSVKAAAQDIVQPGNASRKGVLGDLRKMLVVHGSKNLLLRLSRQDSTVSNYVPTHKSPPAFTVPPNAED